MVEMDERVLMREIDVIFSLNPFKKLSIIHVFFKPVSEAFEYLRSDLPLPNDQIKIQCNFSCFELVKLSKQGIDLTSESSLNDDLNDILRSAKWSDIILTCEGEEFKVHKLILSARSKVFAGMFRHKMAETKNHRVDIKDMGKEVLRQMLMYIYTDKTDNLDEVANGLLLAADMVSSTQSIFSKKFLIFFHFHEV